MRNRDRGTLRLGPGLITGACNDDPSSVGTYSQVGAQFGYTLSWTLLVSFPLLVGVQDPEERALSREHLEGLLDEVHARLSPMGLELFYALVVREESAAAVATRMNMNVGAVHAWSSRLKRLVRALVAREDEGASGVARRSK